MKRNFLMFFLGALAMGAVLALVSSASNEVPQSSSNNELYNEIYISETYELNSPEVVQAEVQFVQSDVQNWEIDNNLEVIFVDTGEPDVQYWEINDELELVSKDADETGVKSLTLARSEFLQ